MVIDPSPGSAPPHILSDSIIPASFFRIGLQCGLIRTVLAKVCLAVDNYRPYAFACGNIAKAAARASEARSAFGICCKKCAEGQQHVGRPAGTYGCAVTTER